MVSNIRILAFTWLGVCALIACRSPQDPSDIGPFGRDGGTAPGTPEVQPDTGKPIGPIAGSNTGGKPSGLPDIGPSLGGVGGMGGIGGIAGAVRVTSR